MRNATPAASNPPMISAAPKGRVSVLSGAMSGSSMKMVSFLATGIVRRATQYAPMAMKPAWPREKMPVKPCTRFMERASTMLMAHRRVMRMIYALALPSI